MRPWVKWLIDHNLSWIVKTIVILALPLFITYYVGAAIGEGFRAMCSDLASLNANINARKQSR